MIKNYGKTDIELSWGAYVYTVPAGKTKQLPSCVEKALITRFPDIREFVVLKEEAPLPPAAPEKKESKKEDKKKNLGGDYVNKPESEHKG